VNKSTIASWFTSKLPGPPIISRELNFFSRGWLISSSNDDIAVCAKARTSSFSLSGRIYACKKLPYYRITPSGRALSAALSLFRLRADNPVQLVRVSATVTHPFRQSRDQAGQQSLSCAAPLPRMDDINLMISINWVVGLISSNFYNPFFVLVICFTMLTCSVIMGIKDKSDNQTNCCSMDNIIFRVS
jgi:hypothetical protein